MVDLLVHVVGNIEAHLLVAYQVLLAGIHVESLLVGKPESGWRATRSTEEWSVMHQHVMKR